MSASIEDRLKARKQKSRGKGLIALWSECCAEVRFTDTIAVNLEPGKPMVEVATIQRCGRCLKPAGPGRLLKALDGVGLDALLAMTGRSRCSRFDLSEIKATKPKGNSDWEESIPF